MSDADRSRYAEAVTRLSEGELRDVLSAAEPPICLLGGWAVHLHDTDGFRNAYDRPTGKQVLAGRTPEQRTRLVADTFGQI